MAQDQLFVSYFGACFGASASQDPPVAVVKFVFAAVAVAFLAFALTVAVPVVLLEPWPFRPQAVVAFVVGLVTSPLVERCLVVNYCLSYYWCSLCRQ